MPYKDITGRHERASRLGHSNAVVRAIADRSSFYVPAEHVSDLTWLEPKIHRKGSVPRPENTDRLTGVIGVDGSLMVVPVRDGLPSVRYAYAQAAAIWLDVDAMEGQRAERFVDPVALARTVNSALVSFDFPAAGAYVREGMSIRDSWRESINTLFQSKKVEVNRLDQTLMQLLYLLHGEPGSPAATIPVSCPSRTCRTTDIATGPAGTPCPTCGTRVYPTDLLRIQDEVVEDGSNESPLGRLMQVVELLVTVGLATLLWAQARDTLLCRTLFLTDGPLAMFGPPAKLRSRALAYFQAMMATTMGGAVHVCGIEKTGTVVDYAGSLAHHGALLPGDLLPLDAQVIAAITQAENPLAYGSETYWGRKFIYRALDGRVVVITVVPREGAPYDDHGGQGQLTSYPSLGAILDVIDRTGSSMYRDGIIPVALAHAKASYPIGVGTDVLRLAARRKLGLDTVQRMP